MADAGVLWLQLTGGEPLIDPLFAETHAAAWDMGMMIQISSNGSRLDQPKTLGLLTTRRPYRLTLSLYGATEESYDGMTRRRGSFRRFMRGLAAAHEARLPMRINIVVSNRNAHEVPAMKAIADRFGVESFEYTNISPTIHGGAEVLPSQSREMLRTRKPYTGCNAGITHFHADPHGKASICKIGRDPQVDLITEGADGLRRLAAAADSLLTRHGGCTGCTLQKTCGTCMPLASHSDWTPDNVLVSSSAPGWSTGPGPPSALPGPTRPAGRCASWHPAATPRPRPNTKPPAFPSSRAPTRRTSTCSPPPTSGCGTRSRSRHKRLDSQDGTSREIMGCLPTGSLSPADEERRQSRLVIARNTVDEVLS
jgi:hypothetical protein